jgi:hypothetical protein
MHVTVLNCHMHNDDGILIVWGSPIPVMIMAW